MVSERESLVERELEELREELIADPEAFNQEEDADIEALLDEDAALLYDERFGPMDNWQDLDSKQKKVSLMSLPFLPLGIAFRGRHNIPFLLAGWILGTGVAYETSGPVSAAAVGLGAPAYVLSGAKLAGYAFKKYRANPHIVDREGIEQPPIQQVDGHYFDISQEIGAEIIESTDFVRLSDFEDAGFDVLEAEEAAEFYASLLEGAESDITA